jgi:hypothetical protein
VCGVIWYNPYNIILYLTFEKVIIIKSGIVCDIDGTLCNHIGGEQINNIKY